MKWPESNHPIIGSTQFNCLQKLALSGSSQKYMYLVVLDLPRDFCYIPYTRDILVLPNCFCFAGGFFKRIHIQYFVCFSFGLFFFSSLLHTVFFVYWIDNSLVCCLRLLFMTIFCGSALSLHVKNIKIEWLVYLNKIYFEDHTKKIKFLIVHTILFSEWIFSVNERVI